MKMHELSIMEGALELACERARQAGAARIHEIRLRIGALSGVMPEALQFAFEALAPGTMAEKSRLIIEAVPARYWCAACRTEFELDESIFPECPACHQAGAELRAGREMDLASMEIE